jgi:hypothetical protein
MKAVIEFVGYFRSKTGMERFLYDFDDDSATVRDIIIEAEKALRERDFVILRDGGLIEGVLVFHRKENGGMERIFTPDTPLREIGNNIVLANLMGGG